MRQVCVIVASLLVVASVAPLSAAFPAIIMLYGGSLKAPVFVVNRTVPDGDKHGFLSCNFAPSPVDAAVRRPGADRPYISVAVSWNNRAWNTYMSNPAMLQTLKPEQATMHARLYLPEGASVDTSKPAICGQAKPAINWSGQDR